MMGLGFPYFTLFIENYSFFTYIFLYLSSIHKEIADCLVANNPQYDTNTSRNSILCVCNGVTGRWTRYCTVANELYAQGHREPFPTPFQRLQLFKSYTCHIHITSRHSWLSLTFLAAKTEFPGRSSRVINFKLYDKRYISYTLFSHKARK